MRSLRTRHLSSVAGIGAGLWLASACSAGSGNNTSGVHGGVSAGATSAGGASTGSGGDLSSGNTGNVILNTSSGGAPASDGGCQHVEVNFVPKIPSVFVLVDRSGSMFDSMAWEPLKAGVLSVVMQLQGQIKFGFSAFTGTQGSPGICPIFNPVAPALNNYTPISTEYNSLMEQVNPKGETPVGLALPLVEQSLNAPGNDGDKYILFVTDGEPDFCDDGDSVCPVDSTVSHLQLLKAKGITTIVFGIKSALSDVSDATLQAFANAGAGQPVALPFGNNVTGSVNVCDNCNSVAGWKADWATTGRTMDCRSSAATVATQSLGTYAATDGTATVYRPNGTDQAALTAQIQGVIKGIKSCLFDLNDVTVNLARLSEASVSIQDVVVPLVMSGGTDGWRMNTSTQLELIGKACTTWNQPANTKIDFNFPCDILGPK